MTNLSGANLNNGTAVGPQGEGMDSPSTFPKYPDYKDSGVDWLGEVPLGWRVGNLKHALVELVSGGTPESNNSAYWSDGDGIPWVAISDMTRGSIVDSTAKSLTEAGLKSKGLKVIPAGGLLYSIYASIGKVAVLGLNAATNQAILGLMLDSKVAEQSFIKWWLVSLESWVKTMASSNTQDNLNAEKVRNLPLVFPSLLEQTQIARFLDHETARIDALIEEQQRLIELLKEKRQAVISHAVTKGLDPTVPMKDSGVEWLGEVPAHWIYTKLGRLAFMQEGPGLRNWQFTDQGTRVICVTNITESGINFDKLEKFISEEEYRSSYRHFTVRQGDLMLSSSGNSWGKVAEYTSVEPVILNTSTIRLNELVPLRLKRKYLRWFLESKTCREQLDVAMTGACQPNFGPTHLNEVITACPPVQEQIAIASYLDGKISEFRELIRVALEMVDILQERRSALISAAVTGKIDVRCWQPLASAQAPELAVAEAH